jgi:hypothetical protein
MFRSAYITFTKLFQVYNYPFDDKENNLKGVRSAFTSLFAKQYNSKVRYLYEDGYDFEDEYISKVDYFSYLGEFPFIKKLGPLKLWISHQDLKEGTNIYGKERFFSSEIELDILKDFPGIPAWAQPTAGYLDFKDVANDQRFSFINYSLGNPLYISAHYKGKCVATGRIFASVYSSGFVVMNIAISLRKGKYHNSINDILPINTHLNPWDVFSKVPWEWKSKVCSGTLAQVVNEVKKLFSDSIFTSGTFVNETMWHKSIKLHSDESDETVTKLFELTNSVKIDKVRDYVFENKEWRKKYGYLKEFDEDDNDDWWTDTPPKAKKSINYILFSKSIDIHNYYCEVDDEYLLHRFWHNHRILEKAMIQKSVLEAYVKFLNEEIIQLRKWRLDKLTQLAEGKLLKLNVFIPAIYDHIYYIKADVKKMAPFYRRIYSEYSRIVGLNKLFEDIKEIQPVWEEECLKYEAMGITISKTLLTIIQNIIKYFPK